MGDDLFAHMTKGPVHTAIEVCVNDFDKRDLFLEALKSLPKAEERTADFVRFLKEIAQVTERAADYLEHEWFEWWPQKKLREPIIRQGIIQAIEMAEMGSSRLPIAFYWIGVGDREKYKADPNIYPFETIVARSDWQVTCLLVTPPSPDLTDPRYLARLTSQADIWIIKAPTSNQEEEGENVVIPHGNGLITTRVKALPFTDPMQSPTVRTPR